MADVRELLKGDLREVERQRHVVLRVPAGVAEHHALVAGSLILRVFAHHATVDVLALLVDLGEDSAGVAVEHVVGLVVADAVDHSAHNLLDVNVRVLGTDLAADDHKSCRTECLACHLGLGILTEELVKDCV